MVADEPLMAANQTFANSAACLKLKPRCGGGRAPGLHPRAAASLCHNTGAHRAANLTPTGLSASLINRNVV